MDADLDRTYVSGIERQVFNPTVDVLDKLAAALGVDLVEFFVVPEPGEVTPSPLKSGRKRKGSP